MTGHRLGKIFLMSKIKKSPVFRIRKQNRKKMNAKKYLVTREGSTGLPLRSLHLISLPVRTASFAQVSNFKHCMGFREMLPPKPVTTLCVFLAA